ncbi:MAG: hypothetical protein AAB882_01420 [Patescibacteria group bacterium]
MSVLIPVGLGELYDKISILEIKAARIREAQKLAFVHKELSELRAIAEKFPTDPNLYLELKDVNELIWDNVGKQWEQEVYKKFDKTIIQLSRNAYIFNDKRATIKKNISLQSGSTIIEVKSYASTMNQPKKIMSSILLDFHHGIGDELICNGLVREYCKKYETVGIFCLKRNYPSVSFMYRDLTNLRIHVIHSHLERRRLRFLNAFRFGQNHYDEIRAIDAYDEECGIRFERQVYARFSVPLEKKWDSFFVERDLEREEATMEKTSVSEPYQFVHDDGRFPLDRSRISPTLPIIEPTKELTNNVFDCCGIIERAAEIHVVDSSFIVLIDCLPYKNDAQRLYKHAYARQSPALQSPMLKKPWIVLS